MIDFHWPATSGGRWSTLRRLRNGLLLGLVLASPVGCRMSAPIHVWQPPLIESTVGKKVVLSEVAGPKKTADLLREKLIVGVPSDTGRTTIVSQPVQLEQSEAIRLVSATEDAPSDIALQAAASLEGYDYVLRGEILKDRRPPSVQANGKRLTVSWRLSELGDSQSRSADQRRARGAPVVVDRESAIQRYPDLGLVADEEVVLATAAVRDTYRLFTPSTRRDEVTLAIPYLMPGSAEVRQGNMAARAGRWDEAKRIWTQAAEDHSLQIAAVHNLALAAAAAQDFSTAKTLARKAIRRQPTKLHKQTAMWIERMQREYHEAFDLPDPPEGWFLTKE
ncbi:hypothetical protein [Planctomycetes bacterium K23_9]|uniref:Uncharacterized protein n=1 Tax=Stieleria marina TaxID=1930275 RepID=A0A517NQN1_9BACT|nr:hypothetical protein K239x_13710 [Planctomycetes bacterium K23_9]